MLVDISPNEAYKIIKDCDVARGWKQYAIESLFKYVHEKDPEKCIDIIGELVEWSHYESTKSLLNDYSFDDNILNRAVSIKVWADLDDPERNTDGYKIEYLVPPY